MILREKSNYYHDTRNCTNGQTAFTLTRAPSREDSVTMFAINGTELLYGTDFIVSGKTVTYIGSVPFQNGDKVIFKYFR